MHGVSLSSVGAFLWTFVVALVLALAISAWEAAGGVARSDLVTRSGVQALVYGGFVFAVWRRYSSGRSLLAATGLRNTPPALVVLGGLLGVALQAPTDVLQGISEALLPPFSEQDRVRRALDFRAEGPIHGAVMLVSVAGLVPLVEELFFRGALFGALCRRRSAPLAAFVTGVCFLVSHADYRLWPALTLVATVLSYLRLLGGSLLPCIAFHGAFNGTVLGLSLTGLAPAGGRLDLGWPAALAGTLASIALCWAYRWLADNSPVAIESRQGDADA